MNKLNKRVPSIESCAPLPLNEPFSVAANQIYKRGSGRGTGGKHKDEYFHITDR